MNITLCFSSIFSCYYTEALFLYGLQTALSTSSGSEETIPYIYNLDALQDLRFVGTLVSGCRATVLIEAKGLSHQRKAQDKSGRVIACISIDDVASSLEYCEGESCALQHDFPS
jgi:hypothetical protein